MNLSRFQVALNHEDTSVIARGLNDFADHVLAEHGCRDSFGYCCHSFASSSETIIIGNAPNQITGLLKNYILSSPQVEELHYLWTLPGRAEGNALIAAHCRCLAALLYCSCKDKFFAEKVVHRIANDFAINLKEQLKSSHTSVVHHTLALLITMCRVSSAACKDIYQRVISLDSSFGTLLQKGKPVSWQPPDAVDGEVKLATDSRYLVALLVFQLLLSGDKDIHADMMAPKSILRRVTNGIHADPPQTLQLVLEGLTMLLQRPDIQMQIKSNLADASCIQKVIVLSNSSDESAVEAANVFLMSYVHVLERSLHQKKGSGDIAAVNLLLKHLTPQSNLRHRELQMLLLAARPALLTKCIAPVAAPLDEASIFTLLCGLSHVCTLLHNTDVDPAMRSKIKTFASSESASTKMDLKKYLDDVVRGMFPSSLTKKELSKLLQHSNAFVQRMALLLLLRVLQRIGATVGDAAKRSHALQAHVATACLNHFPEIQLVFNIRAKYGGRLNESPDDQALYMASLSLSVIEACYTYAPAVITLQNMDITRLLDDIVLWQVTDTCEEAAAKCREVCSNTPELLQSTLSILRIATEVGHCRWFGTLSDMVKRMTNILVSSSWSTASKHTPLSKLILLASASTSSIRQSAVQLLRAVLISSEVFCGHGKADEIMKNEMNAWINSVNCSDNSIFLLEVLFRLAVHWNASLCLAAYDILFSRGESIVPFSPLMTVALKLTCLHFSGIADEYPNHIKSHLAAAATDEQETDFLAKFRGSFVPELVKWMQKVLLAIAVTDDNGDTICSVGKCLEQFLNESQLTSDATFLGYISNTHELCVALSQDIISDHRRRTRSNSLSDTSGMPFFSIIEKLSMKLGSVQCNVDIASGIFHFASAVLSAVKTMNFDVMLTEKSYGLQILFMKALLRCGNSQTCVEILRFIASHLSNIEQSVSKYELDMKSLLLADIMSLVRDVMQMAAGNEKICGSELQSIIMTSAAISTDCFRHTRCSDDVLKVMQTHSLLKDLSKSDMLGDFIHYVYCICAVLYARRRYMTRKKKHDTCIASDLWRLVADEVKRHAKKHFNNNDVFCLVWTLQDISNDAALRLMFAKNALDDNDMNAILEMDRTIELSENQAVQLHPLTPLQSSLLLSSSPASEASMSKLLLIGVKHDSKSDDTILAFLCDNRKGDAQYREYIDKLNLAKRCTSLDEMRSIFEFKIAPPLAIDCDTVCNQIVQAGSQITAKSRQLIDSLCIVLGSDVTLPLIYNHFLNVASMQINSVELVESTIVPTLLHTACTSALMDSKICELFSMYCTHCTGVIAQSFKSAVDGKLTSRGLLMLQRKVQLLISEYSSLEFVESLQNTLISDLCKLVKTLLKYSLAIADGMQALEQLLLATVSSASSILYQVCGRSSLQSDIEANPFHPALLFEMVIGHSGFIDALTLSDNTINLPMLRVLVILLNSITFRFDDFAVAQKNDIMKAISFVQNHLKGIYRGTLSVGDRCILRTLYLCHHMENTMKNDHSTWDMHSIAPRGVLRKDLQRNESVSQSSQWVLDALVPPIVYSTLAHFPSWRSVYPQPLSIEIPSAKSAYSSFIETKHRDINAVAGIPDGNESDTTNDDVVNVDTLLADAPNVYDISFWLPALHNCLSSGESISIRQLSNCGALSLILGCVTCPCIVTRMYSYSCLQIILQFLKEQTPDKDVVFRERPQLLLLVSFLKNAIGEKPGEDSSAVFRKFPVSSGIFLARAALHLLQPQHELFAKINKYLLSKPFCDVKDVPLYELGVVSGDLHEDGAAVLSAVRFLRDCVRTKQDHLNMCRKNAYSRLMHTFLLFSRDLKIGHAILDIFDRALSTRHAARYLIERCDMIAWLTQCASIIYAYEDNASKDNASQKSLQIVANIKLMPRVLILMRRTIGAIWLLAVDGLETAVVMRRCIVAVTELVKQTISVVSASDAPHIGMDYMKQLILCMWDITVSVSSLGLESEKCIWKMSALLQLGHTCRKVFSDGTHASLRHEAMLSVMYLTPFSSPSSNEDKKELISLIISLTTSTVFCHSGAYVKSNSDDIQFFAMNDRPHDASPAAHTNMYYSAVHVMAGDVHSLPTVQKFDEVTNFTWEVFSNSNLEAMHLPIHQSSPVEFIGALSLKTILGLVSDSDSLDFNESYEVLRWTLVMNEISHSSTMRLLSCSNQDVNRIHRRLALMGSKLPSDLDSLYSAICRDVFYIVCITSENWLTSQLKYHSIVPVIKNACAVQLGNSNALMCCKEQLLACSVDHYNDLKLMCTDVTASMIDLARCIVSAYDVLKYQDLSAGEDVRNIIKEKAAAVTLSAKAATQTASVDATATSMNVANDPCTLIMPHVSINRFAPVRSSKVRSGDRNLLAAMKAAQKIPLINQSGGEVEVEASSKETGVRSLKRSRTDESESNVGVSLPLAKRRISSKPRGYMWLDRYSNKLMKFRLVAKQS